MCFTWGPCKFSTWCYFWESGENWEGINPLQHVVGGAVSDVPRGGWAMWWGGNTVTPTKVSLSF
jgi:hypothetical protein